MVSPRRPVKAVVLCGVFLLVTGCSGSPDGPRLDSMPADSMPADSMPADSMPADTVTVTPEAAVDPAPSWASGLPRLTRQVVRTVSSHRWCAEVYCTTTQAWERRSGSWVKLREFGSTIGPHGWGKARQDDGRTPAGVFGIKITFSTTAMNPGAMPWRRRLPTSTVTDEKGPLYNTWIEEPGRADGDRPSMRWGFVVDYNNVRLAPGSGPAPVPDAGSGIFYHTSRPGHRWEPSEGCTRLERPRDMRWLLRWLRPGAHPRVVQNL